MDLIIVESSVKVPSVTEYAKAAGLTGVRVMATGGHLLDMPPMGEGLCINLATWEPTRLVPRDDHAAQRMGRIETAIASADRVFVASDLDREGEGIASELWDRIPASKRYRVEFATITPRGIKEGIDNPRSLKTDLVEAFLARRLLDRFFGFYASALTFEKMPGFKTSAGRVQSPALRLVWERWKAWLAFKPETYFTVSARLRHVGAGGIIRDFTATVSKDGKALSFPTELEAGAFGLPLTLTCVSVEGREKEQKPRPPFNTSAWLQVAQKALRMPIANATNTIQALFDAGSTTYPRTDSVRVCDEAITWAREELTRRFGPEYVPVQPWDHKDKSSAQAAHEAIYPTLPHGENVVRKHGSEFEEAFRLIEGRFLASQACARRVRETVIKLGGAEGLQIEAKGLVELFPGWKKVYQLADSDAEESSDAPSPQKAEDLEDATQGPLPLLQQGEVVQLLEILVHRRTTRPQGLFTQASLVAELDRLGIGRPATFEKMVQLILERLFVAEQTLEAKGKNRKEPMSVLVATNTGDRLASFLVQALPDFMDFGWTAKIEQGLDKIEGGKLDRMIFLQTVFDRLWEAITQAKATIPVQQVPRKEFGPCPKCLSEGREGRLTLRKGRKKGSDETFEFAGCSLDTKDSRLCGYRAFTVNEEICPTVPCPTCSLGMRPVQKKDGGQSWVCEAHGWHLAGKDWNLVKTPLCPDCRKAMEHRKRTDEESHFWGCFVCRKFHDSDAFGAVLKPRKKRNTKHEPLKV